MRLLAIVTAVTLFGCGYHTAGSANLLPADLHTIAIVPWGNATTQYKLPVYLAEAVSREVITRTRYKIVADPTQADAVLSGGIVNVFSGTTIIDPTTARGTGAQVTVQLQVKLVAKDGKVLFNRSNLEFRDRYEVSLDPKQYFDESEATLQRISRDAARSVVSAMLENF